MVGGSDDQGVGIGGYLLGGGYSRTTNQFGLGADNITAYQVVLPDGRIVDAEDGTGFQDLFYALMVRISILETCSLNLNSYIWLLREAETTLALLPGSLSRPTLSREPMSVSF